MTAYTYAVLELSPAAYREISEKLREAGYGHAFKDGPGGEVIDMNGLAVKALKERPPSALNPSALTPAETGPLARNAARRMGVHLDPQGLRPRPRFPNPRPIEVRTPACSGETDITKTLSIQPGSAWQDKPGTAFRDANRGPDRTAVEPFPVHPSVPEPPAPLPQDGVRIAIKNDDGNVLALDLGDGDGFNLPGGPVAEGEEPREAAVRLLEAQVGLETDDLIKVWSGPDDKYQTSHAFIVLADNDIKVRSEEGDTEFVKIPELLCGTWGLFVRDAFNAAGWMNRPRMNLKRLYEICQLAVRNGSHRAQKGVDMVIDEVTFLTDIGKLHAVDVLLGDVDVAQLHADVAHTLLVMVEPLEGLRNKKKIEQDIEILIEAVDGQRTPIRFGPHEDIRAAARKQYRAQAAKFGKMLRDGTLAQKFGGRHRGGKAIRTDVPDDAEWPPPDVKDVN